MQNTAEIALGTNIGFGTIDLLRNIAEIALGTDIGFVTIDLRRNIIEIALGTNIGLVTAVLHLKYNRNRIEFRGMSTQAEAIATLSLGANQGLLHIVFKLARASGCLVR